MGLREWLGGPPHVDTAPTHRVDWAAHAAAGPRLTREDVIAIVREELRRAAITASARHR